MANPSNLWVRDAFLSTADIGDTETYGTVVIDLLWKARTGKSQQKDDPNVIPGSLASTVQSDLAVEPTVPGAAAVLQQSSLGQVAPHYGQFGTNELPVQDVTGAVVKRIRLVWNAYFAEKLGDTVGNHNYSITQGHYEGILTMPMNYSIYKAGVGAVGPHPGGARGSVQWDWLHWKRHYAMQSGFRLWGMPLMSTAFTELGYSHDIDTRCSRRITEQGASLCYCFAAAPGFTINGFSMAWSVLLQLPGA